MIILGIDPSFTGTGLALLDEKGDLITSQKLSNSGMSYSLLLNHEACKSISKDIITFIGDSDVEIICEYPVFNSRSGAYLAILHGYLSATLVGSNIKSVTWVGPKHCDSFIKNKSHNKTYIVEYCKEKDWIHKRTSHDECTAIILGHLLLYIKQGLWKNSYFTWYNPQYGTDNKNRIKTVTT